MSAGYMRKVNEKPETWELQVSTGRRDKNGKYIKKYRRVRGTKRLAEETMHDFYAEVHGTTRANAKMSVNDLATIYEQVVEKEVKKGERKRTANKTTHAPIHVWIRPYIGKIRLSRLSADDLQYLVDAMSDDLSPKTVKNYFGVLCSMLDYARKTLKIPIEDIHKMVTLPKYQKPKSKYFNEDEARIIMRELSKIDNRDMYKSCFLICLFGGIRVGELSGINREDYDSKNCIISIERERQTLPGEGIIEDTPKSEAGSRLIELPRTVCRIVDEFLVFQDEQIRSMTGFKDSGALIMSGANAIAQHRTPGDPVSPLAVSRAWHRFCDNTEGLEYKSLHKLRHTHASILKQLEGVSDTAIQQHMGHADLAVTHSIYSHLFSEQEGDIAKQLEDKFFGGEEEDMEVPVNCEQCKYVETIDGELCCGLKKTDKQVNADTRPEWCPYDFGNELLQRMLKEYKG